MCVSLQRLGIDLKKEAANQADAYDSVQHNWEIFKVD